MVAKVIIDISHEAVDRPFEYIIPDDILNDITEGICVKVPFGKANKLRKAYVVGISDKSEYPVEKLKYIDSLDEKAIDVEDRTMKLIGWMHQRYGCTMNSAMQTVLTVKKKVKENYYKTIIKNVSDETIFNEIDSCTKRQVLRKKLLLELRYVDSLPMDIVLDKLGISKAVIETLAKNGIVRIETTRTYRNPKIGGYSEEKKNIILSQEQENVKAHIISRFDMDNPGTTLLYGVTGSGKTEVYMQVIEECINRGKQAIVLIPEIALTFQNLFRFYERFGDRVSVVHSRLSEGEKYDQFERAKNNEIDIIIGPRSALFTPFNNLGIIIIDEEHENSYKSEKIPKYHAREVAEYLAKENKALLLLASATPSMESYYKALQGEYYLEKLTRRNNEYGLPRVHMVDMRKELKKKNKSYFSAKLRELLIEKISNGQQAMLFINRRGFAGFVSCRECGYVMKCPHCDVSLTEHGYQSSNSRTMCCHYCGYEIERVDACPKCGSKYFAGFKAGTEKIQEELEKLYPSVKVLRMDGDTTKNKDDYEKILSTFSAKEADVLVGTQMIVKGHDFPGVTLVGIIAADLSLNSADFRSHERTFQLITQAAGRAGRGKDRGDVVVQTYNPDDYAIVHSANQNYEAFFEEEMSYRKIVGYPPVEHMLAIQFWGKEEEENFSVARRIYDIIKKEYDNIFMLGPVKAMISKISDVYRAVIYVKAVELEHILEIRDFANEHAKEFDKRRFMISFDIDPVNMF